MEDTPPIASKFTKSLGSVGVLMLTFSALSPVASVYVGGQGVLKMAGTGAAIAYILGGVVAAIIALIFAELGAAFPRAGGSYPAVAGVLGPAAGYPMLISAALTAPVFIAFAALGLADYARVILPDLPVIPLAIASIIAAAAIAVATIRTNAVVTGIFLAVEGLALLLLAGVAVLHLNRSLGDLLAHPVMLEHGALKPTSLVTLGLATVAGAWSTAGASWAMYFAEEMKDARRKIGRVIAWSGVAASLVIATPLVLMLMSVRDVKGVLSADTPVAYYLSHTGGPMIGALVSLGVLAAIFNNVIAAMLGMSRYVYATARDRAWPEPVNRVLTVLHPRLKSPVAATLLLGGAAVIACFVPERTLIILLAGDVIPTLLISVAVWVGRNRGLTGQVFRAPAFPLVPLFGIAVGVASIVVTYMDAEAGRPSMLLLTGIYVASLAFYAWRRSRSRGWAMPDLAEGDSSA